jgi:plastocyanin
MSISRTAALGALLVATGLSGCGSDYGTNSSGNGPKIQATAALAFSPATLNLQTGVPMQFVFGSTAHTVIFDAVNGKPEDISTPTSSASVTRTFNTPGDFPYHCNIHAGMSGTVHVTVAPVSGAY